MALRPLLVMAWFVDVGSLGFVPDDQSIVGHDLHLLQRRRVSLSPSPGRRAQFAVAVAVPVGHSSGAS